MLESTPIKLNPDDYRTYIAPAGVSDIIDMFSWGGISESSLQQRDSALIKMRDDDIKLSPCFLKPERMCLYSSIPWFGCLNLGIYKMFIFLSLNIYIHHLID